MDRNHGFNGLKTANPEGPVEHPLPAVLIASGAHSCELSQSMEPEMLNRGPIQDRISFLYYYPGKIEAKRPGGRPDPAFWVRLQGIRRLRVYLAFPDQ
jgi:hypothetical protein